MDVRKKGVVVWEGEEVRLIDLCNRTGVSYKTAWKRLKDGRTLAEAIGCVSFSKRTRQRKKVVAVSCLNCKKMFEVWESKVWREKCCSSECKRQYRAALMARRNEARKRACKQCGREFIPRQNQIDSGMGLYCSNKCFIPTLIKSARTEKALEKQRAACALAVIEGRWTPPPKGTANPGWKGGPIAARRRQVASGKSKERLRKYRERNPHRVKEWSQKRSSKKTGRLPRGTVAKIFALQKGKCAICRRGIHDGYHADHIVPLSRGGGHISVNIQLLCPPCNLRKSAKDPIEYMQAQGFLL